MESHSDVGIPRSKSGQFTPKVWTEAKEILIMKCLLDITEKKGVVPTASDVRDMYNRMKSSLPPNASESSFRGKVKRLKKKFKMMCPEKGFSTSHEREFYELAVNIWGRGLGSAAAAPAAAAPAAAAAGKSKDSVPHRKLSTVSSLTESIRFDKELGTSSLGEDALRQGLELLDPSSRKVFDEKWENLLREEMKLTARRLGLLREQTEACLRARNQ